MNHEDNLRRAFQDFVKHSSQMPFEENQSTVKASEYAQKFFEDRAADLEVSVEYYMKEFLL